MNSEAPRQAIEPKSEPDCYVGHSEEKQATPGVRVLIRLFPPGSNQAALVAFFGNRTTAATIRNWRIGRRKMPPWAIERLRQETALLHQLALNEKAGPGSPAGNPQALSRWRASRR